MSFYPNLIDRGYKIEAELGRNQEGGRITWKGIELSTQQTVIIKQFCFAKASSTWSGYKAYEREITVLQKLNHPYIPRYLTCIETESGFCLVQSYIPAVSLPDFRQLTLLEVKQTALKILDILIYLHLKQPPILHCDLQPENILIDRSLNTYLIDFGFASLGSKEAIGSSVFKGTPGFIAPEQIIQPTMASDIYSLGIVLVWLLVDKDMTKIRSSVSADNPYQLNLKVLLPQLDRQFLRWLQKMTHAKLSRRFSDALSAKQALLELDWPIENSDIELESESQVNLRSKLQNSSGILTIFGLSSTAVWAVNFASDRLESNLVNLAIAILATVAVGIGELGASAIATWDRQARIQGAVLAVLIPVAIVSVSGLIWGIDEAIVICSAIAVTELLLFSYLWWQIPMGRGIILKTVCGLGAIALGIIFGFQLI